MALKGFHLRPVYPRDMNFTNLFHIEFHRILELRKNSVVQANKMERERQTIYGFTLGSQPAKRSD